MTDLPGPLLILEALAEAPQSPAKIADRSGLSVRVAQGFLENYQEKGLVVPPTLSGRWTITAKGRAVLDGYRANENRPDSALRALVNALEACNDLLAACEADEG